MQPKFSVARFCTLSAVIGALLLVTALSSCVPVKQPSPTPTPGVVQGTEAATPPAPTEDVISSLSNPTPSGTPNPEATDSPAESALPGLEPTYDPNIKDSWKSLPIIPETISDAMKQLYIDGQKNGNNRRAFSKVGDCETSSEFFLKPFDMGVQNYNLGTHTDLQELLNNFRGSFGRVSLAAKPSFSVSSVFSSIWADPALCNGEYPISCEYKLNRPAFALIMFGTNDVHNSPEVFEKNLRALVKYSIQNHVVPILATKADNLEGDFRINETIARVAYDYQVPLWNFWRAMQELPNDGLKEDQVHFTYGPNDFSDPEAMKMGWPVRNLSAMLVLDKVWREAAAANGESY